MKEIYIAVDGDNVGNRLEYLMLLNDLESLGKFSESLEASMQWLQEQLIKGFGAVVFFNGGDNLLARVSERLSISKLDELRSEFASRTKITLSIGVGETPQEAYFALKLAKVGGKNVIRQGEELKHGP
jgi:GTP cyclohydrolase III